MTEKWGLAVAGPFFSVTVPVTGLKLCFGPRTGELIHGSIAGRSAIYRREKK